MNIDAERGILIECAERLGFFHTALLLLLQKLDSVATSLTSTNFCTV